MKLAPLWKQIGGKRKLAARIVDELAPLFASTHRDSAYHEPFVGGGAVFCELYNRGFLEGRTSVLGDANRDLVRAFDDVQKNPRVVIANLEYLRSRYMRGPKYAEELYYEVRDFWNAGKRTTSRFMFLKATSFNGLWRVNKQGELNASWGKYAQPKILDAEAIRAWHHALQGVTLHAGGYDTSPRPVDAGDIVYVDPPYSDLFTGFHEDGFDYADHVKLLGWLFRMRERGAGLGYSNTWNDHVDRLLSIFWPKGAQHILETTYVVNTDGAGRVPTKEVFVVEGW